MKEKLFTKEDLQKIKNTELICLDFDDCIIPWFRKVNGKWERNEDEFLLKETKKNVSLIKDFCKKNNINVFVISSWSLFLEFNGKKVFLAKDAPISNIEKNYLK
jgi:hypothetical protein